MPGSSPSLLLFFFSYVAVLLCSCCCDSFIVVDLIFLSCCLPLIGTLLLFYYSVLLISSFYYSTILFFSSPPYMSLTIWHAVGIMPTHCLHELLLVTGHVIDGKTCHCLQGVVFSAWHAIDFKTCSWLQEVLVSSALCHWLHCMLLIAMHCIDHMTCHCLQDMPLAAKHANDCRTCHWAQDISLIALHVTTCGACHWRLHRQSHSESNSSPPGKMGAMTGIFWNPHRLQWLSCGPKLTKNIPSIVFTHINFVYAHRLFIQGCRRQHTPYFYPFGMGQGKPSSEAGAKLAMPTHPTVPPHISHPTHKPFAHMLSICCPVPLSNSVATLCRHCYNTNFFSRWKLDW